MKYVYLILLPLFFAITSCKNKATNTKAELLPKEDTAKKYEAWGWRVTTIDGNDAGEIYNALATAVEEKEKPVLIIGKTIMGKGVDFMETGHEWHGIAPNDAQLENALGQLEMTLGDF